MSLEQAQTPSWPLQRTPEPSWPTSRGFGEALAGSALSTKIVCIQISTQVRLPGTHYRQARWTQGGLPLSKTSPSILANNIPDGEHGGRAGGQA